MSSLETQFTEVKANAEGESTGFGQTSVRLTSPLEDTYYFFQIRATKVVASSRNLVFAPGRSELRVNGPMFIIKQDLTARAPKG